MTSFALGVYVFQKYGSAAAVSLVTLLAFLPTILLSPVGGVLADRFDRRLMMMCGDLFSAFGLVFILVNALLGSLELWMICVGVTISAVFVSLLEPAYKATITDLLTGDEYAKASGLVQLASAAKYLISPLLAGIILGFADIRLILIIDISTILITVLSVAFVRKSIVEKVVEKAAFHPLKELKEGWDVVTKNKGIMELILLMAFVCFNVGFLQTLLSPMILSFADSKTLGIIESISAIGMLIGSLIIGALSIKKNFVNIMAISLLINGVFMALVGSTANAKVIVVTGILFFATLPFVNTSADTLARLNIPNEVQGRAWGVIGVLSQLGYIIAYAISGPLADNVFCPLLVEDGILAESIGKIIGVGKGRGIGLMFILAGIFIVVISFLLLKNKNIRQMEMRDESCGGQ